MTARAYRWLLQFNAVPDAWRYAPNKWTQAAADTRASEAGL